MGNKAVVANMKVQSSASAESVLLSPEKHSEPEALDLRRVRVKFQQTLFIRTYRNNEGEWREVTMLQFLRQPQHLPFCINKREKII